MTKNDPVVIVSAVRTPIGSLSGQFKDYSAHQLGAIAIKSAVTKAQLAADQIEEVIMGCVLTAGQGQAPARQAAIAANLSTSTSCTTINKMCGSGMKALMYAHDALLTDKQKIIVAGGMESMSSAPYLLLKGRNGYRLGHGQLYDHLFLDGLEDAYQPGQLMGHFAEKCAQHFHFSRAAQDQFALTSLQRVQQAIREGSFAWEIAVVDSKAHGTITQDELPLLAKPEKIPLLKPAFDPQGTITAANASAISDGAAALVLMRQSTATALALTPLAKIIDHVSHAQAPDWFTTAPISAINKLLAKIDRSIAEIDLFEINEAFAVVTMAAMQALDLPANKVNIHGGACALGHPIGASGARIVVTLIAALRQYQLKRGIASLCIGGGEATAIAIELLD